MRSDEPIAEVTELIENVRCELDDGGRLFAIYQEAMERYASREIGRSLQRLIHGSDVYSESFTNVLLRLKGSPERVRNRGKFVAQLKAAMRNLIATVGRREGAEKRGGKRRREMPDHVADGKAAASVLDQLVANETSERVQAYLASIADPLEHLIAVEHVVYRASARQIHAIMQETCPDEEIPSERSISRSMMRYRLGVLECLQAHVDMDAERQVTIRRARKG